MTYPVGTRVWVRCLGDDHWPGTVTKAGHPPRVEFTIIGKHERYAFKRDVTITAALIPGPTTNAGPLRWQLEGYARREVTPCIP